MTHSSRWFFLGLFAVLLPYLPLLRDPTLVLLYRDLSQIDIPVKSVWLNSMLELGRVTHWNPYNLAGTPYLADANAGPLYPLNWILYFFRPLGLPRALTIFLVAHHPLIYSGGFLLLRKLRVRPALAMLGGLTLALGGFAMSSDNLRHMLGSQIAPPFFFYFLLHALGRERVFSPWLFLASAALAWPVYAGDPQYAFILGLVTPFVLLRKHGLPEALARGLALAALAVLASAPQLLPTLAFIPETGRAAEAGGVTGLLTWSMHPLRFLEMLFPLAFGESPASYWGAIYLNSSPLPYPFVFSLYLGALPCFFLALWLLAALATKKFRARLPLVPVAGFAFFALAAMGEFAPVPLFEWLAKVPPWSSFRHPERLAYWPFLFLTLAAFLAGEKILRTRATGARWPAPAALLTLLAASLAFGLFLRHHDASLFPAARAALVLLGLAALFRNAPRWLPLLALLAALDLETFALRMVWPAPALIASTEGNVAVAKIREDLARRAAEISRGAATRLFAVPVSDAEPLAAPGLPPMLFDAYQTWALLDPNLPAYFRLDDVRGHFGLMPRHPVDFWRALGPLGGPRARDLLSARYFVTSVKGEVRVLASPTALPYVFLPAAWEIMPSYDATLARLLDPRWDFHRTALLEGIPTEARGAAGQWEILSVEKNWDERALHLKALAEGPAAWLVLQENFHRHWSAASDAGESLRLARANGWAIGLELPPSRRAGEEATVHLRFREPLYPLGLALFAAWLACFLAAMLCGCEAPMRCVRKLTRL